MSNVRVINKILVLLAIIFMCIGCITIANAEDTFRFDRTLSSLKSGEPVPRQIYFVKEDGSATVEAMCRRGYDGGDVVYRYLNYKVNVSGTQIFSSVYTTDTLRDSGSNLVYNTNGFTTEVIEADGITYKLKSIDKFSAVITFAEYGQPGSEYWHNINAENITVTESTGQVYGSFVNRTYVDVLTGAVDFRDQFYSDEELFEKLVVLKAPEIVIGYYEEVEQEVMVYHIVSGGSIENENDYVKDPEIFPKTGVTLTGTEYALVDFPINATRGSYKDSPIEFKQASISGGAAVNTETIGENQGIRIKSEYAGKIIICEYDILQKPLKVILASTTHDAGTNHVANDSYTVIPYSDSSSEILYESGIGTVENVEAGKRYGLLETFSYNSQNYTLSSVYRLDTGGICEYITSVEAPTNGEATYIAEYKIAPLAVNVYYILVDTVHASCSSVECNKNNPGTELLPKKEIGANANTTVNVTFSDEIKKLDGETTNVYTLVHSYVDNIKEYGSTTTSIDVDVKDTIVNVYVEYVLDEQDPIEEEPIRIPPTVSYKTLELLSPLATAEIKSVQRNVSNPNTLTPSTAMNLTSQTYEVLVKNGDYYGIATHENNYIQLLTASRNLFKFVYGQVTGKEIFETKVTKNYPYVWWQCTNNCYVIPHSTKSEGVFSTENPNLAGSVADGLVDNRWWHDNYPDGSHYTIFYNDDNCCLVGNEINPTTGRSIKVEGKDKYQDDNGNELDANNGSIIEWICGDDTYGTHYCSDDGIPDCGLVEHVHSDSCWTHSCLHTHYDYGPHGCCSGTGHYIDGCTCASRIVYCGGCENEYDEEGNIIGYICPGHLEFYCSGNHYVDGCGCGCRHSCWGKEPGISLGSRAEYDSYEKHEGCYIWSCTTPEHSHNPIRLAKRFETINIEYTDNYSYQYTATVTNGCYYYDKCAGHQDKTATNTWFWCNEGANCPGTDRRDLWPPMTRQDFQCENSPACIGNDQYTLVRTYKYGRQYKYYFAFEYDGYQVGSGTVYNDVLPGGSADMSNTVSYTLKNECFKAAYFPNDDNGRWRYLITDFQYHLMQPIKEVTREHNYKVTGLPQLTGNETSQTNIISNTVYRFAHNIKFNEFTYSNAREETRNTAAEQAEADLCIPFGSLTHSDNSIKDVTATMDEPSAKDYTNDIWLIGENVTVLRVRNDYLWHDGYIMEMYGRMAGNSEVVVKGSDGINDVDLNGVIGNNGYYATNRTDIVAEATTPDDISRGYINNERTNIRFDNRGFNINNQRCGPSYFVSPSNGIGWNTMFTNNLTIPRTVANLVYPSTFSLTYNRVADNQITNIRNQGIPGIGEGTKSTNQTLICGKVEGQIYEEFVLTGCTRKDYVACSIPEHTCGAPITLSLEENIKANECWIAVRYDNKIYYDNFCTRQHIHGVDECNIVSWYAITNPGWNNFKEGVEEFPISELDCKHYAHVHLVDDCYDEVHVYNDSGHQIYYSTPGYLTCRAIEHQHDLTCKHVHTSECGYFTYKPHVHTAECYYLDTSTIAVPEDSITRYFNNINSVTVDTPVYIKISMSTNYEDTQVVLSDEGQERLTSFPLELDKEYVITAKTDGQHRYAKGYGNKEYDSWIKTFDDKWAIQLSFPFDVYLKIDENDYEFYKAGQWLMLDRGEKTATFKLPVWTIEKEYKTEKGGSDSIYDAKDIIENSIVARVVAENDPNLIDDLTGETLNQDHVIGRYISNKVVNDKDAKYDESVGLGLDAELRNDEYILYSNSSYDYRAYDFLNVSVVGITYEFKFEYTDDSGFEFMMERGFEGMRENEIPFGKKGDNTYNPNYQYGLQLGSKFKFSLRTKGTKSSQLLIEPVIYYVPKHNVYKNGNLKFAKGKFTIVDIFYENDGGIFEKLTKNSSLAISTNMMKDGELPVISNLNLLDTEKVYDAYFNTLNPLLDEYKSGMKYEDFVRTDDVTLGSIGNVLIGESLRLRINRIMEYVSQGTYGDRTPAQIIAEAGSDVNFIKSISTWYGEYRLPTTTVAVEKGVSLYDSRGNMQNITADGYLVVCFNIKTLDNNGNTYLSYQLPLSETRWLQNGYGTLPNYLTFPTGDGLKVNLADMPTTADTEEVKGCAAVAIYELLINNEQDVVGPN